MIRKPPGLSTSMGFVIIEKELPVDIELKPRFNSNYQKLELSNLSADEVSESFDVSNTSLIFGSFDNSNVVNVSTPQKPDYLVKPLIFEHQMTKTTVNAGIINHPSELKSIFENHHTTLLNSSTFANNDSLKSEAIQLKNAKMDNFKRSISQILRQKQGRLSSYGFKLIRD